MANTKIEKADQGLGRIVSMMRNPQFKNALEKIDTDPGARAEAKANAKEFFRRNGAHVDDELQVEVKDGTWSIYIHFPPFVSVQYTFD